MEIKHITLGINNKTHNVNSETNNDKITPFNNAILSSNSTLVLICKKCGNVISVEAKGSAFIKQEASDFYISIEKKQIEK